MSWFEFADFLSLFTATPSHDLASSARLSTVLQILIYLPLTLSTLSTTAFLLLSLLLFGHSLIHGTLVLFWGSPALSVMQVPMHPFLLLVCFNAFSQTTNHLLVFAASWWGKILHWSSPGFIVLEGMSSLLVAQRLGQVGRELVGQGESFQFGLLIGAAAAYVTSAWWVMVVSSMDFLRLVNHLLINCFLVLPRGSGFPSSCGVARFSTHGVFLPYVHRFCFEKNECNRVFLPSLVLGV